MGSVKGEELVLPRTGQAYYDQDTNTILIDSTMEYMDDLIPAVLVDLDDNAVIPIEISEPNQQPAFVSIQNGKGYILSHTELITVDLGNHEIAKTSLDDIGINSAVMVLDVKNYE